MLAVKFFKYCLKFFALVFLIAFVVLNRQDTSFYYSPLNTPLTLPLWGLGIVIFSVGFMVGALLLWLNSWPVRHNLRQAKKDLKALEKDRDAQVTDLNNQIADQQLPAPYKQDI